MNSAGSLVLVNSSSPCYSDFKTYIQPYLDHFGVPYLQHDLATAVIPPDADCYALIIIGHRALEESGSVLDEVAQRRLVTAVQRGSGLVSFDGDILTPSGQPRYRFVQEIFGLAGDDPGPIRATSIEIHRGEIASAVTERHSPGEVLTLFSEMPLPRLEAARGTDVLATGGGQPLLIAARCGQGRVLQWISYAWAHTAVRGPLFGLDDLVWRGLAWAARKPFVMRGLPPFVTMRVDDVSGWGQKTGPTPLWWVRSARQCGFKPWLGLFIGELSRQAVDELKGYIADKGTTASVHAFTWHNFFYFDHWKRQPFPDATLADHFVQARGWYGRHGDFARSKVVLGHFYEMGANALDELARWGVEFLGTVMDIGLPYDFEQRDYTPWLSAGPFRKFEQPRRASETRWPAYYTNALTVPGSSAHNRRFFNVLTEIRDNAGYEWAPDNDVAGSAERGVTQLRRALDSMALATLFTHESDYIHRIHPGPWEQALAGVTQAIASYDPVYVTLDEACRYLRALDTSRVEDCRWEKETRRLTVTLTGRTDVPIRIGVFLDNALSRRWLDVPAFQDRVTLEHVIE